MAQLYQPLLVPAPKFEPAPNPLDTLLQVVQANQDRRMKQQQLNQQNQLYGLRMQEGTLALQKGRMEFDKWKKKETARTTLAKEMQDMARMGTDRSVALGLARNRAYELDPELGKEIDTELDKSLNEAKASKNIGAIALIHNAKNPNDLISNADVEARYFEPTREVVQPGATVIRRSPVTGKEISREVTPDKINSIQEMLASGDPAKVQQGLEIAGAYARATHIKSESGGGSGDPTNRLFSRMQQLQDNFSRGVQTLSKLEENLAGSPPTPEVIEYRNYVGALGAQLKAVTDAYNRSSGIPVEPSREPMSPDAFKAAMLGGGSPTVPGATEAPPTNDVGIFGYPEDPMALEARLIALQTELERKKNQPPSLMNRLYDWFQSGSAPVTPAPIFRSPSSVYRGYGGE